MAFIVATTTSIHNETGANNLITCCAPYFNPSSSSSLNTSVAANCGGFGGRTGPSLASVVVFLFTVASGLSAGSVACINCT